MNRGRSEKLGKRSEKLGKRSEKLGKQSEKLGKQSEKVGKVMRIENFAYRKRGRLKGTL